MPFRLGRKAVQTDSRTLKLKDYLTPSLAPAPSFVDWSKGITSWGMMLNDTLGDCTIAGVGHAIQVWSANASQEIAIPDSTVLDYYEWWDGYVNGDPSTDNGGIELQVLNRWKAKTFAGHKLSAFVGVRPSVENKTGQTDFSEVKQAIALFGGAYIGLNVPNYIMDSIPPVWDVPGPGQDTGIAGGHCVFVVGYDPEGVSFISWGGVYKMTWGFWLNYVDEVWALLSPVFVGRNGLDPSGLDMAQLAADLEAIK